MKKAIQYFIVTLTAVLIAACQEYIIPEENGFVDSGKVNVTMSLTIPDQGLQTKAFEEEGVPIKDNGLYVAVYESGYRCEVVYVPGDSLSNDGTTTDGSPKFKFGMALTTSDKPRNLHFFSADGFDATTAPYEESRIGELTTSDGIAAYWQIKDSIKIVNNVSEVKSAIGTISLIRNFAKVTMDNNASNFTLLSYKVYNTPKKGYVAPYLPSGSNTGFVDDYNDQSYEDLCTSYAGRIPSGTGYNQYTTDADYEATAKGPSESTYFYERPAPTGTGAAFIIVKGTYNSITYYYKINLCDDEGNYYALLRGFRFKINIEKVTDIGYETVAEAIKSIGSGNVSTSLEYRSVTNISDGNARLFVSTTSVTVVGQSTIKVKYKFCPDASSTTPYNTVLSDFSDKTKEGVGIFVSEPEDELTRSIAYKAAPDDDKYDISVGTTEDADGYRTLTINTTAPEGIYKEQVVTIKGRGINPPDTTVIQREIHIIVRPILQMSVECPASVTKTVGTGVLVKIGLEDELPESIFPLNFKIEAGNLTLTPDNSKSDNNLPVESGTSSKTGKPTFYYVKTVTYAAYTAATKTTVGGKSDMREIDCYFITNTAASATNIYVSNDLFTPAETSFTNP